MNEQKINTAIHELQCIHNENRLTHEEKTIFMGPVIAILTPEEQLKVIETLATSVKDKIVVPNFFTKYKSVILPTAALISGILLGFFIKRN